MFCTTCGKQLEEASVFCPHCGAGTDDTQNSSTPAPSTENATVTVRYLLQHQATSERKEHETDAAYQEALYAAAEYKRLKSRRTNCIIAAFVCAWMFSQLMSIYIIKFTSADQPVATTGLIGLFFIVGLLFPFGFMPIKDFIADHGFVIVFAVIFVVILFFLIVTFATFAGIPYFFYLQSKISAAKRDMEAYQARAESYSKALQ